MVIFKQGCMRSAFTPNRRFVCILCFSILILLADGCKKKPAPPPPPDVQVITLAATNVPVFEEWIGTLDGFVNAQIRAQVTGYLLAQNYAEGSEVKTGDLLFQIDPRPFQAALDQAHAKLVQDEAQSGKTELDVKRYTPLAKEQAISQEQLDNAVQANLAANALVKADEAAVENARLNLGFTKIKSPIDGLAGTALAQIGDLLSPSSGLLTTVSTLDPIKVYFQISEQSYLNFWRQRRRNQPRIAADFRRRLGLPANREIFLRRPPGQSKHRHAANRRTFSKHEPCFAPRPIRSRARANANHNECIDCAATRIDGTPRQLSGFRRGQPKPGACPSCEGRRANRIELDYRKRSQSR